LSDALSRLQAALADHYRIERELGRGGMATVYLAHDIRHDRPVALKVLHPELAATLGPERFLGEIRLTARLQHPHILPLFDSGDAGGLLYYVMPYVEGESLRQRLDREGQLPVEDALQIGRNVLGALAYAHEHGVIHRDIKPENIMLERGEAVVADFGIARAVSEAGGDHLTQTGFAVGTPTYMSPEQASAARELDGRSDLYSLGCVLYETLAGEPPFSGPSAQAVIAKRFTGSAPKLTSVRDTVPDAVEKAVERSLARLPADRFATAAQFADALTIAGAAGPAAKRPSDERLRRSLPYVAAAVVLGLGIAIMTWRRPGAAGTPAADVITVAPFRVSGADPALRYLREGMVDLLAAKLTGEAGPRAVDPRTALAAWRHSGGSREEDLPQDAVLEISRRLGAGQLLLGEVVGSATRLVLNASVLNASQGRTTARASVDGPVDSLPALIDRLIGRLLALRAGENQQRLSAVTSTSLEALRAYLEGQSAYRRGQYREGVQHFRRALAEDSAFALAGMGLFAASDWLRDVPAQQRGLAVAWAHRDRLSTRDRAILNGYAGPRYPASSSQRELLAAWEDAATLAPDQPEVWYEVGDPLYHFGAMIGEETAAKRAALAFERAVTLDSTYAAPLSHLVDIAARARDTAQVRLLGALSLAADPNSEIIDFTRWRIATASGDPTTLKALRARYDSMEFQSLRRILASMQLDDLMLEEADRVAAAMVRAAESPIDRQRANGMVRELALNRGRPSQALAAARARRADPSSHAVLRGLVSDALHGDGNRAAAADAVRELSESADGATPADDAGRAEQAWDACLVNLWRAAHGDTQATARGLSLLRSLATGDDAKLRPSAALCAATVEATIAGAERRNDATAVQRLDSLLLTGLVSRDGAILGAWDPSDVGSLGVPGNLVLARLLETQGDLAGALTAVRRRPYIATLLIYLSSFLREEGRLAALTGDRAGAIRSYRHYLSLRSNPEPSLRHEVERVRAELAKLLEETR
jgi:serine/threonine-protein kinase